MTVVNPDPSARSTRKYIAILEASEAAALDWRDPAQRENLADLAFTLYERRVGPKPSEMPVEEVRESWFRYADRLRDVFLPACVEIVSESLSEPGNGVSD